MGAGLSTAFASSSPMKSVSSNAGLWSSPNSKAEPSRLARSSSAPLLGPRVYNANLPLASGTGYTHTNRPAGSSEPYSDFSGAEVSMEELVGSARAMRARYLEQFHQFDPLQLDGL